MKGPEKQKRDPKKFEPVKDPAIRGKLPVVLNIPAPPCIGCQHWRPVATTNAHGELNGVRLCHAEQMFGDFSCFDGKGD